MLVDAGVLYTSDSWSDSNLPYLEDYMRFTVKRWFWQHDWAEAAKDSGFAFGGSVSTLTVGHIQKTDYITFLYPDTKAEMHFEHWLKTESVEFIKEPL